MKADFEELARRLQREVDEEIKVRNAQLQRDLHEHRKQGWFVFFKCNDML